VSITAGRGLARAAEAAGSAAAPGAGTGPLAPQTAGLPSAVPQTALVWPRTALAWPRTALAAAVWAESRPRAACLILSLDCRRLEALAVGGGVETGRLSCNSEKHW
jgi:hypothetical protein